MLTNHRLPIVAVALTVLVGACVAIAVSNRRADRSFGRFVVATDTSRVESITIEWPNNDTVLNLNRTPDSWVVVLPMGNLAANSQQVDELLACLSGTEIVRQMSNSEQAWPRYGVSADSSTHVVVRSKHRIMADFYCGKVGFDPQLGNVWTYVRTAGRPNVYMTDGYLNLALNRPFHTWTNY